jgi:hypothetical protein
METAVRTEEKVEDLREVVGVVEVGRLLLTFVYIYSRYLDGSWSHGKRCSGSSGESSSTHSCLVLLTGNDRSEVSMLIHVTVA